jgi:hypothetical protein
MKFFLKRIGRNFKARANESASKKTSITFFPPLLTCKLFFPLSPKVMLKEAERKSIKMSSSDRASAGDYSSEKPGVNQKTIF